MMREIKFRAWIHGAGDPRVTPEMKYVSHSLSMFFAKIDDWPLGCELMQYTGIKDKDGVEIYEGDVTRQLREDNCFSGNNKEEDIVIIGEPEWSELGSLNSGGPDGDYPLIEIEVIGNIYENPELLND